MDAWNLPKRVNRIFVLFLDDLKSINRYEFEKLYNSELLQDDEVKKYLKRIIKRDQKVEQEDD